MIKIRNFLTLSMASLLVFLVGCGSKNTKDLSIVNDFESKIQIIIDDNEQYECEFTHTPENINVVKVNKPEKLGGLTFSWMGNKKEVMWKDLKCEMTQEIMSKNAVVLDLVNAVNTLNNIDNLEKINEKSEFMRFKGKTETGEFEVHINDDGYIQKIILLNNNKNTEILFEYE